mgnify:CR=1 FL=1
MFISNAYAASATSTDFASFLPLIVIFVLFFFMIIRPQMKQAKEQRNMIAFVVLEIAAETEITVQKHAIQSALPEGTIKSI